MSEIIFQPNERLLIKSIGETKRDIVTYIIIYYLWINLVR